MEFGFYHCVVGSSVVVLRRSGSDDDRDYDRSVHRATARPRGAVPRSRAGLARPRLPHRVQGRARRRRDGGHPVPGRRRAERRVPALAAARQTNTATAHTQTSGVCDTVVTG